MIPAHSVLTAPGARPRAAILLLHGILGSRANWRAVARRLTAASPRWAAVLVDLRMHGDSQGYAAPQRVSAAAGDLNALERSLPMPVRAILGHSFGGKVALARAAAVEPAYARVIVVDSMPGPRPGGQGSEAVLGVVGMLARMPRQHESRSAFVERVVAEGHDPGLARWLAMNLSRHAGGDFELRLDLDAISALLEDYFAIDLWPVVEEPREGSHVHLVIGGRSAVFGPTDRARAEGAAAHPRVSLDVIPDAGHWVHIDAPDALLRILSDALAGEDPSP